MLPEGLLREEQIRLGAPASSRKKVLETLAGLLTVAGKPPGTEQIYEKLLERERLGSTGLSHGIALPHARIRGLHNPRGAFLRLENAIDFDARDGKPVDLVFGLLVPDRATETHLALLASLARLFDDTGFCDRIRNAGSRREILDLFHTPT